MGRCTRSRNPRTSKPRVARASGLHLRTASGTHALPSCDPSTLKPLTSEAGVSSIPRRVSQNADYCARILGEYLLLIDSFRLRFGKEFLKIRIVTDWGPDGVDLQTRSRRDASVSDSESTAESFSG